jgi:hypothetical protein
LKLIGAALLIALLAACSTPFGSTSAPGTIEVQISDHREAIGDFERLDITIEHIGFHPTGAPRTEEWLEFEPDVAVVDLTQVVDGPTVNILETSVPPGAYDAVRLTVTQGQGVLQDNTTVELAGFEEAARLEFVLQSGERLNLVIDVVVESEDDHPGGSYQMYLSSVEIR